MSRLGAQAGQAGRFRSDAPANKPLEWVRATGICAAKVRNVSRLGSQRPTWAPSLVFPTAILVLLTALRRWKRSLEIHCGLQPLIDFTQKLRRQSADPFGHLGPVQRGHLMADGEARLG